MTVLHLHPSHLPAAAAAPVPAAAPWTLRLLGTAEVQHGQTSITHFSSRPALLLLARLALAPARAHPREELVELLWPGVALEAGRNRLRNTLSVLKAQLESAGATPLLLTDRMHLRIVPGAMVCDALEFERCVRQGDWDLAEQTYRGELLPGLYDEWVLERRAEFAALAERLQARPRLTGPRTSLTVVAPAADPGQLPAFWTRLFGVEGNLAQLSRLLQHHRLVTVVGAGGSGKTRLAVAAAQQLSVSPGGAAVPRDQGGPWVEAPRLDNTRANWRFERTTFVSMVDCVDAPRAIDAIAAALRVQGRDPLKGLALALAGQRTLLLLDNCEQLVGQLDGVLQQLLTDCAALHVMVTSRVHLDIGGEQVFELGGLPLPPSSVAASTHSAAVQAPALRGHAAEDSPGGDGRAGDAAVALFIDRASAAAPGFSRGIGVQQRPTIEALVRHLSGMPLAIELAASRMRNLSPEELLGLLTEGKAAMLDLLQRSGSGSGLAHRHASMRHVVDWSWRQLPASLRPVLQAVAAFAAPARCEAVAAVADLSVPETRERLAQLHDHSLVLTERDAAGTQRHVLLQPVREFVIENTPAELLPVLRSRLRRWLLEFGRQQAALGQASIAAVEAELGHLYGAILGAAVDGARGRREAVALTVALRRHWEIDTRAGLPLAVMQALREALPDAQDDAHRCEAAVLLAYSLALAGMQDDARALADQAVDLASAPVDAAARSRLAYALLRKSQVLVFSPQDPRAVHTILAEAEQLAESSGDQEALALVLRMQFLVAVNRDNDHRRAEGLAQRVQALWERIGHRRNAYSGLMDRASCWLKEGRLDEAATALAACERAALQEGYATGHIMASWQLGRAHLALRRFEEALAAFRRCLQESWRLKRLAYVADALVLLPGGLALAGHPDSAALLQAFAQTHWERQFGKFYPEMDRDFRRTRRWLHHHLGSARMEALRLQSLQLTLPAAVALAMGEEPLG